MIRSARVASEATAHYYYQQAVTLYKQKHYPESLKQLALGLQVDVNYKPLYLLARDIFAKLNGVEERRLFAIALSDFDQFQAFFDLGYHFIDSEHYELAAALLEKALALAPTNIDAAYELAFAYMARFNNQAALKTLAKVDYESDFWAAYLYYQCKLWLKQPEGVAEFIQDVQLLLKKQSLNDSLELIQDKINELEESFKRYQQLTITDKMPIRDWHFVQYGAAILHYNEENKTIAGGRYTHLQGDNQLVYLVLNKLVVYLQTLNRVPEKIIALPDSESELLGQILAQLLQRPCNTLEMMEDFSHCLMVAADSSLFNGIEPLVEVCPQQTVFALNHSWLKRSMIVPDVVGFLTQEYVTSWAEADLEQILTNTTSYYINKIMLNKSFVLEPCFKEHLEFYQSQDKWLKGGIHGGVKRSPYSIESPVGAECF
ncbi:MAG: tetratricopeptide repeat protein [Thiofilum sp.]|uniref:tetratricopeptide repeat protein n=1 Tax=Thiofilum sp. TaxID=2212733 RepID=UPI0025CF6922|nr:tetratricopeptide repeat protein [Thiofilum sp.]MBK8454467.1 hypothetical protein [Thiofilum sp.]